MRIFLTGAGGFIGSHLTQLLLRNRHGVRALVHYNSQGNWGHLRDLPKPLSSQLDVTLGDVTDPSLMHDLVQGCDVVIHLAALIGIPYSYIAPSSYVTTNVNGTLNVLEACRRARVRRLVIASTSEVYGTAEYTPIDEQHPLRGQSPYSASKIAADKLAESYYRTFDLPVVTLRPFNTFGPRQSARAVIPTILGQALSGAREIQLGNLKPKRDLTYVEDTARAFELAATVKGIEGETIHVGQGSAISIGELGRLCLRVAGAKAKLKSVSRRLRPEKSEVGLLLCNAEKARKLLNWQPKVSLEEGLYRTTEYLREHAETYGARTYVV